ncbi:PREDICTED: uncharacterized protein LOC108749797 isoform X2 [Trachymyrmex septentrionalis]|uniref:uncharacterized protein LOC108749797 isoform X2 n=1 Tax=Trachymyrmex septentrionalis TaxID=34720 RepID=UPI00084EDE06|nr:PREDICTED: uncharacterized protein LOC108749797 isoform X2 [Trachymyrmex septentrionalis]
MPQIMAEAFARGLLDKIMIEVLDVIDRDAEDGKSWKQHVTEETDDTQLEHVHGRPQANELTRIHYSKADEIELIAKIVRDLRDIRIGDSRYVLPPSLLTLEKQVKYATCNVDDAPLMNNPATDIAETQRTTRGQGDTYQINATILESLIESTEPVKLIRKKKEGEATNEATNVSVDLLQQLIEDLENKTVSTCSKDDASLDSVSKECIAVWEEKEEEFIRTIEGNVDTRHETTTGTLQGSESNSRFRIIKLKHDEELRSHSSQHVASTSREADLEEVHIEKRGSNSLSSLKPLCDDDKKTIDQILPIDDAEKRKTFNETTTKKKKKKGFGSRLRKLFRTSFGRQKN